MTKLLRLRKLNLAVLRKQLAGTEKDRAAEMEDELEQWRERLSEVR